MISLKSLLLNHAPQQQPITSIQIVQDNHRSPSKPLSFSNPTRRREGSQTLRKQGDRSVKADRWLCNMPPLLSSPTSKHDVLYAHALRRKQGNHSVKAPDLWLYSMPPPLLSSPTSKHDVYVTNLRKQGNQRHSVKADRWLCTMPPFLSSPTSKPDVYATSLHTQKSLSAREAGTKQDKSASCSRENAIHELSGWDTAQKNERPPPSPCSRQGARKKPAVSPRASFSNETNEDRSTSLPSKRNSADLPLCIPTRRASPLVADKKSIERPNREVVLNSGSATSVQQGGGAIFSSPFSHRTSALALRKPHRQPSPVQSSLVRKGIHAIGAPAAGSTA